MQTWLDNFKALNGLNNNAERARVTSHGPSKAAQRRLGKALGTKYAELAIANRRSRRDQVPVITIGRIDQLPSRTRRAPRRA